jgi:SAM-dependent methyltransferase
MPRVLKQGQHADPLDPALPRPDPRLWPVQQRRAFTSPEMRSYRESLLLDASDDVRAAILDDLSTFFGLEPEECVRRCIDWEQWTLDEWQRQRRDSPEDLVAFYKETKSWAFDLLWYAYLQAEGYSYPVSVAIAQTVPPRHPDARHLDFGSGVGATSQLFARLGYQTDLADISTSLLAFGRFRLERREERATYIDLNSTVLEDARYDVITAIDTLVHVPDVPGTARLLHRALRPGGLLFANFDVRPKSDENAAFLYEDDLPLRWQLQRAGFEPEESLDGMITKYRRVEPKGVAHRLRGVRDVALLRSPARPLYRSLRHRLTARSERRLLTTESRRSTT